MLLAHTDAPVMFVKLSCVLVLDSLKMSRWKSCTTLFSFQQTVRPLRLAPLSSMQCTLFLFFFFSVALAESVTLYFICSREVKGIGYQSRFEVVLSLSSFAGTCTMLLSVSLNCSFLLITSLTSSFSSSCSLFSLFLEPSVTNAYPLVGLSLHHLTTFSVFKSKGRIRRGIIDLHLSSQALRLSI